MGTGAPAHTGLRGARRAGPSLGTGWGSDLSRGTCGPRLGVGAGPGAVSGRSVLHAGEVIKHGDLKCVRDEGMPIYKAPLERGVLIIQFLVSAAGSPGSRPSRPPGPAPATRPAPPLARPAPPPRPARPRLSPAWPLPPDPPGARRRSPQRAPRPRRSSSRRSTGSLQTASPSWKPCCPRGRA